MDDKKSAYLFGGAGLFAMLLSVLFVWLSTNNGLIHINTLIFPILIFCAGLCSIIFCIKLWRN